MSERPLYTILGTTSSATPLEIKKAYHQQALRYHPDKVGPQGTEKFTQIQAAYDVLSDPSKRAIYDKYGEQGLSRLGSAPDIAGLTQLAGTATATTAILATFALCLVTLLIFLSFLCVKIEEKVEWGWAIVFIPAYILGLIVTIGAFIGVFIAIKEIFPNSRKSAEDIPLPPFDCLGQLAKLLALIALLGMVAFSVVVSVGLEKRYEKSEYVDWWKYFIPLFVGEGCWVLSSVFGAAKARNTLMRQGIMKVSRGSLVAIVLLDIMKKCCGLAVAFLICARVMEDIIVSWWVVFIPFYAWFAISVVSAVVLAIVRRDAAEDLPPDERPSPCMAAFTTLLLMGLPLATTLMIAAKIEGNGMPLEDCFIPIFIIIGSGICICLCMAVTVLAVGHSIAEEAAAASEQAEEHERRNANQNMATTADNSGNGTATMFDPRRETEHKLTDNTTSHYKKV